MAEIFDVAFEPMFGGKAMKNTTRIIARILMIAIIMVSCVAVVPQMTYADGTPEILDWSGDRWLYPGQQSVKLHIYLNRSVDKVQLWCY